MTMTPPASAGPSAQMFPVAFVRRHRLLGPAVLAPTLATGAILLMTRTIGEYGNSIFVSACTMMIVATGLHVLVHWTGQVSLGQVAFVAIGAFATARANADFGLPLALAVLVGVLGAVVASALIGLPALRLSGFALAIATFAFGFAADQWLFSQRWILPLGSGVALTDTSLFGFVIAQSRDLVVPVVIATVAVVVITVRLDKSGLGRAMRVVAHDEEVAASYGISIAAHKLTAFLFAGACAGLAGAFIVLSIGQVGRSAFPPSLSILYVSAVLLGGRGPLWGSLMAAAGLGALPILLGEMGHFVELLGPLGILLVIRISPDGLNGLIRMQATAVSRCLEFLRSAARLSEVQ